MKQIIFSVVIITGVLVAVAGSTGALFTSTASNQGNTFGAGTLILTINNVPGNASSPIFNIENAAPGDSVDQVLTLKNEGTISASSLLMTSVEVIDNVPATSTNLGEVLTTYIWEDTDNDGVIDAGEPTWVNGIHLNSIPPNLNLGSLASGQMRNFKIKLVFDIGAGNEYQGESISFNFNFQANQ